MLKVAKTFKATGRIQPYETEYIGPEGSRRWGLFGAAKLGEMDGIAFVVDITERKRLEEKIRHMANHDPLTGLPNRRLFMELLRFGLAEARRNHKKAGLLFLDLDRFKEINDSLGHETGDHLLRAVADRLKAVIRDSDAVARIGGDEFIILLGGIEQREDIATIAQKILDSFREKSVVAGHELSIGFSIGISVYPDDSEDIDTLFRYADSAMYYAKGAGRNAFVHYSLVSSKLPHSPEAG
jgi:diguanylate cyclase (GGDEF)-like protein